MAEGGQVNVVSNRQSPHRSSRLGHGIGMIVIHADAGSTDEGTLSWLEDPHENAPANRVSYHYLVGRDGTVYGLVPESAKAWHAGRSDWTGYRVRGSVNPTSIGVCFANNGQEDYRPEQYEAGAELVAGICERYAIPLHLIRGHNEVSPGRKSDPYRHFDWGEFFRLLGLHATGRAA